MSLFRRKSLEALAREPEFPHARLTRALGPVQLTALGIGAIVGAGIFSTVGVAAAGGADHPGAGPALVLSFLLVAVALVLTGLVPWRQLGTAEPLATALSARGLHWMAGVISIGAVLATTSVLLVFQYGQVRIFFSMARDGLLPGWAAKVHPKYRTPCINTWLIGLAVALFAGCAQINEVVELCNIGTLFAFILVAAGILLLRRRHPEWPRPFRVPLYPWVPLAAIATRGYLMVQQPRLTWVRFCVWMAVGLVIYLAYGWRKSRLAKAPR